MFNSWERRAKAFAAVIFYTGSVLSVFLGAGAVCRGRWATGLAGAVLGVFFSFFEGLALCRLGNALEKSAQVKKAIKAAKNKEN